jgi:hypothetical protein
MLVEQGASTAASAMSLMGLTTPTSTVSTSSRATVTSTECITSFCRHEAARRASVSFREGGLVPLVVAAMETTTAARMATTRRRMVVKARIVVGVAVAPRECLAVRRGLVGVSKLLALWVRCSTTFCQGRCTGRGTVDRAADPPTQCRDRQSVCSPAVCLPSLRHCCSVLGTARCSASAVAVVVAAGRRPCAWLSCSFCSLVTVELACGTTPHSRCCVGGSRSGGVLWLAEATSAMAHLAPRSPWSWIAAFRPHWRPR